jgi:hypothetical protein
MIKIEKRSDGASLLRDDSCWDTFVDSEYKVKIFGMTVFHRKNNRKWDFNENGKRVGFKKDE